MKTIKLITMAILFLGCKSEKNSTIIKDNLDAVYQDLIVIDQDYDKALKIASRENKLIFIDFYTSWCGPCKQLDKLVFKNDSIKQILKNDFTLLKYDAENDKTFNLSIKHHINSYPTGIILNSNGYILNRQYGFFGEDFKELSESVFKFTNESIILNKQNEIQKGYSNSINVNKYPRFYIDYVNKDDIKVMSREDFKNYWKINKDNLSEEYFATLAYFADKIPSSNMDAFLNNKEKYAEKYGSQDVEIVLFHMINGRFKNAITTKSESHFRVAIEFMKKIMTVDDLNRFMPIFQKQFDEAINE